MTLHSMPADPGTPTLAAFPKTSEFMLLKVMKLGIAAIVSLVTLNLSSGLSQGLSIGVPVNHLMTADNGGVASTARYTFGPALSVKLWRGFGFDAELLYKRLEFGLVSDPARARIHRIEVPLMGEYVFSGLRAHPFVHAGISFNRILAVNGADFCGQGTFGEQLYCLEGQEITELRHRHTHGPVVGVGLSLGWGKIRLAPELRLTRWVDRNFGTKDSPVRSELTQVELLMGLRF